MNILYILGCIYKDQSELSIFMTFSEMKNQFGKIITSFWRDSFILHSSFLPSQGILNQSMCLHTTTKWNNKKKERIDI